MPRTTPATATTSVRIAAPSEPEQVYINLLTPEERRDALVAVGRVKQRGLDETLRQTIIDRLRNGEIQPQRIDPLTGQPYAGIDSRPLLSLDTTTVATLANELTTISNIVLALASTHRAEEHRLMVSSEWVV